MSKAYNRIFWGVILITFKINLISTGVLQDFIGYLIIGSGIKSIIYHQKIKTLELAHKYCSIITFISFIILINIFLIGLEINNTYYYILKINVFNIVEFLMIYNLLEGTKEILTLKNNELYKNYDKKIKWYMILATIVIIGNNINIIFLSQAITIILVILALYLKMLVIVSVRKIYNISKTSLV